MPKSNTKNIKHNTTSSNDSEIFSLIFPNLETSPIII